MDLLCKRYANPLFFVDNCILMGNFLESIDYLLEQKNEDRYWEMYLATLPLNDKSYEDWRKESASNTKENSDITIDQAENIAQNSQNILSGFKPPQK